MPIFVFEELSSDVFEHFYAFLDSVGRILAVVGDNSIVGVLKGHEEKTLSHDTTLSSFARIHLLN